MRDFTHVLLSDNGSLFFGHTMPSEAKKNITHQVFGAYIATKRLGSGPGLAAREFDPTAIDGAGAQELNTALCLGFNYT